MNIVKRTRAILKMTQAEFGVWLSLKLNIDKPIIPVRVSEWENEAKHPRHKVRCVCAKVVAKSFVETHLIAGDSKLVKLELEELLK